MEFEFLIPVGMFFASALAAFAIGLKLGAKPLVILLALIGLIAAGLVAAAAQTSGYDGMLYVILLIFFVAPAGAGTLAGGLFGCAKRRQTPAPL